MLTSGYALGYGIRGTPPAHSSHDTETYDADV